MERVFARAAPWVLAAGGLLRAWHWLDGRSLWQDEARLARNVADRSWAELLEPLRFQQVAPPGFLWLEKAGAEIFGVNELALRLWPLLAALAALPAFHRLARRCVDGPRATLAVALFALSPALVYYAAELKPYSGDVLVAILVALSGLRFAARGGSRAATAELVAVAFAAPLLSYPALFSLAGVGAWLGARALGVTHRGERRGWVAVAAAALASSALLYAGPLGDAATRPDLRIMWAGGFAPLPPTRAEDWLWYGRVPLELSRSLFELPTRPAPSARLAAALGAASLVAGAVVLARHQPRALAVLALPALAVVGASALGAYPFQGRVILFLVPAAALLVAAPWSRPAAAAVAGGVWVALVAWPLAGWLPEPEREALRPVLQSLARHPEGDAPLYVHRSARPAFHFYREHREDCRVPAAEIVEGRAVGAAAPPGALGEEVGRMRGSPRFWLLFAHTWPWSPDAREAVLREAARFAELRDSLEARNAAAYLFDARAGP